MKPLTQHSILALLGLSLIGPMAGCVMSEKYDAEKARALNFQRLLAQEEKRTGEMDADLKRLKRDNSELEARSRELTAQLQAVREQFARVQDETTGLREAAALRDQQDRTQAVRMRRPEKPATPARVAPNTAIAAAQSANAPNPQGVAMYHEVKPGETLFRVARRYGINVQTLKDWNHLQDDTIEVGQQLIVGHQ
jgi:LysM repeat protein